MGGVRVVTSSFLHVCVSVCGCACACVHVREGVGARAGACACACVWAVVTYGRCPRQCLVLLPVFW